MSVTPERVYDRSLRLLAFAALVACGDDGAPAVDAPTPSTDAPTIDAPNAPFVGEWTRAGQSQTIVIYAASGQYTEGNRSGTWRLDGERLATTLDGYETIYDYYLSPDRASLVTYAMLPVGTTTGVVGTWHGTYDAVDATFVINQDGTAQWTEVTPMRTSTNDGTWTLDGDFATLEFTLGTPVTVGVWVIPDVAIGSLHTRRP